MGQPSTRDRIVIAAARLLQRQGYVGTGVKQIAREAEATLGSLYHFFPDGKASVAIAALQHGDQEFAAHLRAALASKEDPAEAVEACARRLADALARSGWVDGCPITAAALETLGTDAEIQQVCAAAFQGWEELVHDKLTGAEFAAEDAREVASVVISTLEGAEVTAQVTRSKQPLWAAGRQLARLIRSYRQPDPGRSQST